MENGSLMKVESIAECSRWSILQYFRPSLSDNLYSKTISVFFLSGRLRQVLLYFISCVSNKWFCFQKHFGCTHLKHQTQKKKQAASIEHSRKLHMRLSYAAMLFRQSSTQDKVILLSLCLWCLLLPLCIGVT